jgi:hypothetical protein
MGRIACPLAAMGSSASQPEPLRSTVDRVERTHRVARKDLRVPPSDLP